MDVCQTAIVTIPVIEEPEQERPTKTKKPVAKSFKTQPVTPSDSVSENSDVIAQAKSNDEPTQPVQSEVLPQKESGSTNDSELVIQPVETIAEDLVDYSSSLFHNRTLSTDDEENFLEILSKGWIPNKRPTTVEKHNINAPEIREACEEWIGLDLDWTSCVYDNARKPGEYCLIPT